MLMLLFTNVFNHLEQASNFLEINWSIRKAAQIAVVAAMIHGILFSLYGNCRDKIRALI
jgi:hypothetical protein